MSFAALSSSYRAMQLMAHRDHNLTDGDTFFSDHEFFGELYPKYESAYDSLVERALGLGKNLDIVSVTNSACRIFNEKSKVDGKPKTAIKSLLQMEGALCEQLSAFMTSQSEGTKNLLAQLCDDSEQRQYLMRQRLK